MRQELINSPNKLVSMISCASHLWPSARPAVWFIESIQAKNSREAPINRSILQLYAIALCAQQIESHKSFGSIRRSCDDPPKPMRTVKSWNPIKLKAIRFLIFNGGDIFDRISACDLHPFERNARFAKRNPLFVGRNTFIAAILHSLEFTLNRISCNLCEWTE